MVFVSKNMFRKCRWCDKERKKNLSSGRHKGYYSTCGSEECLKRQYTDSSVCKSKGVVKNGENYLCVVCGCNFQSTTSNHRTYCKECVPDNSWRGRASRYLIGKKQWDALVEKQNGTCALCSRNPEVVDHCHASRKVRGLLCNKCNLVIRLLDTDLDFLQRAMEYVEKVKYGI
jgi:hypothetical protein